MKSISGFSLFGTALVLYISSVHVIAEDFDCRKDREVPGDIMNLCFELGARLETVDPPRFSTVKEHVNRAVDAVHRSIYNNCNASVERICDDLPEIVVTSKVGGREQCKDDLKEYVCEKTSNYYYGKLYYRCVYTETLYKIIENDKWKSADEGKKKEICALFKKNQILCFMATSKLCDRIDGVLMKHYCRKALEQGICSDFPLLPKDV